MRTNLITVLLSAVVAAFTTGTAVATITLNFGDANFKGESGQTSGLVWGLVFDTAGDGFDASYSGGFTVSDGSLMGGSNDDTLYLGDLLTIAAGPLGTIGNASGLSAAVASKAFAVIWFQSSITVGSTANAGNLYGFVSTGITPTGTSPSDGGLQNYDVVGYGNVDIALVPEPSSILLCGLGSLMLLRRRRAE